MTRSILKAKFGAIIAVFALLLIATPASAHHTTYNSSNWTFYQGGAQFYFTYTYAGNQLYSIDDMFIKRWKTDVFSDVCDSKARTKITIPSGYNYWDYSPTRSGCTRYIRTEDMSQTTGNYPSGSTYRSYWRDTDTGGAYKYIKGVTITRR